MQSDSEEERKLDPTTRAIKRAERKRRGTRRVATTKISRSRSRSSGSSSDSDELNGDEITTQTLAARNALQKTREQYEDLRADLLQFKQTKVGTLLDESNLDVQARISPLDL